MATECMNFSPYTGSETLECYTPSKFADSNSISKVRVITRVRPFLSDEISGESGDRVSCISLLNQDCKEVTVLLKDQETSRNECFQLDNYFGQEEDGVSQIFKNEVNPLIPGIFHGCNATVFAYGATRSGKTHTMQGTDEKPGLMQLAMSKILSMCKGTENVAAISYCEVYLERCYDLLKPEAREISILDDKDGQIHLRGLSQAPIKTMSEFRELFLCGIGKRKVAHTGLNHVSSRGHAVLVIIVSTARSDGSGGFVSGKLNLVDLAGKEDSKRTYNEGIRLQESGKINLIDLAGKEDNKRTYNEGIRLQESGKINQSLFALSNVVYAVNGNLPRVPYRETKLTRILQDSLGGTSRALMIACLNPGAYQESVHIVSLAARSRHITNYVSSSIKKESSKDSVDMEAKLHAWLESKGKTKSVQRMEAFGSPFIVKTTSSIRKLNTCLFSSAKTDMTPNPKQRTISSGFRNLVDSEPPQSFSSGLEENREDTNGIADKTLLTFEANCIDKYFNNTTEETNKIDMSSLASASSINPSPRKALSPINVNGTHKQTAADFLSTNLVFPVLIEPKTPKTPFLVSYANNELNTTGTPLDKFSAMSSTLKTCFAQEYIVLLNTASREELLELKGIGVKLAEYIVELRERSPLKSLKDLEKIGLSSKQIHNLFTNGAREMFDRTAVCSEV